MKGQMQAGNAAADKLDGVGCLSVCQTKHALKFACLLFRFNDICAKSRLGEESHS